MNGSEMRMIDHPKETPLGEYDRALGRCVGVLEQMAGVRAVYQIGGVSTPGISDLDLVVVFDEGLTIAKDLRLRLLPDDRYLFAHPLYGIPVTLVPLAKEFTAFHNYRLLCGEDVVGKDQTRAKEVEVQIALEFLLRMFIVTSFEQSIGILKLRSFLLHTKALMYDLEFLGVESGRFQDLVREIIDIRQGWFTNNTTASDLIPWRSEFCGELQNFLSQQFADHQFYLPGGGPFRYSKSIEMRRSHELKFHTQGRLPRCFSIAGNLYVKLANRVSRFAVEFPFSQVDSDSPLSRRFDALHRLSEYNRRHLPNFYPLGTSLVVG